MTTDIIEEPRPNPYKMLSDLFLSILKRSRLPEASSLQGLLGSVSMSFTANNSSRHTPLSLEFGSEISFKDTRYGNDWSFDFAELTNGIRLSDVKRRISKGGMQPTVLQTLEIKHLRINTAAINSGTETEIPLTSTYRMASAAGGTASFSQLDYHPYFRLGTDIEQSYLMVYGYIIKPDGSMLAISQTDAEADNFLGRIEHGLLQGVTSDATILIVLVEFVFCNPKVDFDPGDAGYVARCYPLVSYWSSRPIETVNCDIDFIRPDVSGHMHNPSMDYNSGALATSFYTDRNLETTLQQISKIATWGDASAIPTWDLLFDHYRLQANGTAGIEAISTKGPRTVTNKREIQSVGVISDVVDREYTDVKKVAKQGMFDNVHIAPLMVHNNLPIYMAPVCQHDCFHMHWRWSSCFDTVQTNGWSSSWPDSGGPNQAAGTPLIPPNQTLYIEPLSGQAGIRYSATARHVDFGLRPESGRWNIFCHHGFGYVVELTGKVKLLFLLGDAGIYYILRYAGIHNGEHITRVNESTFSSFENM